MTAFECNRCGACCRLVSEAPETAHLDRGDGACRHLIGTAGDEHGCAIYSTRPVECRVDKNVPAVMKLGEWQKRNRGACEVLRLHVYGAP